MTRRQLIILLSSIATVLAAAAGARHTEAPRNAAVEFTPEEVSRILQHSPLPPSVLDSTNRFDGNDDAARFGQFLFFDLRLSPDRNVACSTCHDPARGFSDGRRLSKGIRVVDRHSQSLWNVAHNRWFFWDGRADSLWSQALIPLEHDDEMGGDRTAIARTIYSDLKLRKAYERVFGKMRDLSDGHRIPPHAKPMPDVPDDPRNIAWQKMREDDRAVIDEIYVNVGKAIAAYEARIVSRDAPFDRFVEGLRENDAAKLSAISESAQRGLRIFVGRGNCRLCHSGPNFTDGEFHSVAPPTLSGEEPTDSARYAGIDKLKAGQFTNASRYSDDPDGPGAKKLSALVNRPDNWGQFKTPSLRSVATSPPYMHQGQYFTLEQIIEHYSTLSDAVQMNHHREKILQPLNLTDQEKSDLKAFLDSLTGAPLPAELLRQPDRP